MKTPVLTLLPKHTEVTLDTSINLNLSGIASRVVENESIAELLKSMLYSTCYKIFYCKGKFVTNKSYTIADACMYIPGLFRINMVSFLNCIVDYCSGPTSTKAGLLLSDCMSFELFQMLYSKPVKLYASLLYQHAYDSKDNALMELCKSYIIEESSQPTLDWELLYLKFMETYEED